MGSLTKATTETFGSGGVNSTNIQNDSITNAKIASDAAIANSKLSITFPTISSLSITNGQPAVYDTETVDINGTDFTNGARVDFIDSTTNAVLNLPTVTFVSATQLRVTIPTSTLTEGTDYKIRVTNPDGLAATSTGTVLYSQNVTFSTSSGSLGSVLEGESASFSVSASSNSTIAYSVTSGSLPSGLSLNSSTGAITGTAPLVDADITSTFTITATDAESQTASRSFSITVTNFAIDNSLRLSRTDSAHLDRTPASAGNRRTFTISTWFKRGEFSAEPNQMIVGAGTSPPYFLINLLHSPENEQMEIQLNASVSTVGLRTNRLFRDVSAWYHVVLAVDTTNATADNRVRLYINGVEETSFATRNNPSLNFDCPYNNTVKHTVGDFPNGSNEFDGYLAEFHSIDGQALSPTDFGEFDEDSGIWKPKQYTGTYGTNGFYLDFENSASLGADQSGNGNNFTTTNLAATDQTSDTPTNNFATLNPLFKSTCTLSEGNLKTVGTSSNDNENSSVSTIAMSSGKWYCEVNVINAGGVPNLGILDLDSTEQGTDNHNNAFFYQSDGDKCSRINGVNNFNQAYGATYTTGDIISILYNADDGTITFYKNGTTQGQAFSSIDTSKSWVFFLSDNTEPGDNTFIANFGQDGSFAGTETAQGNADENGYGDFYYTPPSGYLALCTNNLPNPAIADPTEHFNTVLYTGNGSTQSITGVGFQPDWTWIKRRSTTGSPALMDSSRGEDEFLESSGTAAEVTFASSNFTFTSDGYDLDYTGGYNNINQSGTTYVGWNWLANGGTTSSNTDGSITSTVQANTTAGFSIVTYTGTGANATVGHGLGKVPAMIIVKNRSGTYNWAVYHQGNTSAPETDYLYLNSTQATADNSVFWNDTAPTSSVFTVGTNGGVNENTHNLVAYCFAEIEGYSKFGSYTGNGNADGTFVYTGFRPAWLMIKRTDSANHWLMFDIKRDTINVGDKWLRADTNDAESTGIYWDGLSNGFKARTSDPIINASSGTYIYMAFAEAPFKSGTGATTIEGTAR